MESKRIRSPNYPALSLPDAISKVTALYKAQHTHSAPREVAVRGMGYNSLNGASASAISALHKYGLLDRVGDEIKVSDRALRILHPESPEERRTAILEAAREPPLFGELAERFPGRMPSDELLRNYLIRRGFAPGAVTAVVTAYRETSEIAEREGAGHDSLHDHVQEHADMATLHHVGPSRAAATPQLTFVSAPGERPIGRYDYEDGSYIKIVASGDVDTEAALEMVETLIALKRKELARRKTTMKSDTAVPPVSAPEASARSGVIKEGDLEP
jgi:hypothetical protein